MDIRIMPPPEGVDWLDSVYKIGILCIALFNAFVAIRFFFYRNNQDASEKERDRKIQLLKTLVLDHGFANFHKSFDQMTKETEKLKQTSLTDDSKKAVETELESIFVDVRIKFYDFLFGIDQDLHGKIEKAFDDLRSSLTNSIFDNGIRLDHDPKYRELIMEPIGRTRREIISLLFQYRGDFTPLPIKQREKCRCTKRFFGKMTSDREK